MVADSLLTSFEPLFCVLIKALFFVGAVKLAVWLVRTVIRIRRGIGGR